MARLLFRSLLAAALLLLVLALLSPWLLYELGLNGIEGRPIPPETMASAEQQALVWRQMRGSGKPEIEAMNPYGLVMRLLVRDAAPQPTERLAYHVARDYLLAHSRHGSMAGWHLSNAALTIWLTRHWSGAQLATAALPSVERDLEARARRRSATQP